MIMIASSIKENMCPNISNSQVAYQKGRGAIEQIFALQQMIENWIEFDMPACFISVDFKKAFDSVDQSKECGSSPAALQ